MFLKIFKHSFLRNIKLICILGAISVAISLLFGTMQAIFKTVELENQYWVGFLVSLSTLAPMAISVLSFASVILVFSSFKKAVATDEAYLTFTLPATPHEQLLARMLSCICSILIISAISLLSNSIYALLTVEMPNFSGIDLSGIGEGSFDVVMLIIEIVLLAISFSLSFLMHVFAIIIGDSYFRTKLKSRAGSVVVVFIVMAEIVLFTFLFVFGIILFVDLATGIATLHLLLWVIILLTNAVTLLLYYLSYLAVGKKLNVV